jgi:hypothetical protein
MRLKLKTPIFGILLKYKHMNKEDIIELREKIVKGIELAFEKLIITKQKNDGEFVFSKEGKIVVIKASELNK